MHGGYAAAKEVLKNEEITAIFVVMMKWRWELIAIEEAGKKIPDDISVVGFDGLEISEYLVPSLTTVYQPSFDIGYYYAKNFGGSYCRSNRKVPNKVFDATFIARKAQNRFKNSLEMECSCCLRFHKKNNSKLVY